MLCAQLVFLPRLFARLMIAKLIAFFAENWINQHDAYEYAAVSYPEHSLHPGPFLPLVHLLLLI